MNYIDKILEKVKDTESVGGFAIDSFPDTRRKKKRQIIRTVYPESKDEALPKRAMIDLDLTIHKYSKGYKDGTVYDDAFAGAKQVINWLKDKGYEIVIFTTRASEENADELGGDHEDQIKKIAKWLKDKGIYFDRITAEKLAAARHILMLPHPNGEEESIMHAFHECSLGLKNVDKDTLDDSQRTWILKLEEIMKTEGLEDSSGKGLWRVKAEALSESDKFELSRIVDELATSFDRENFE